MNNDDDDELLRFEATGIALPPADEQGFVEHDAARIWYACFGSGTPVILLHGGLGHSGNWGKQIGALVDAGYRVVTIDSRGHGRSTRDARPYRYELMAADAIAVMDALKIGKAPVAGWSDGACTALLMAEHNPTRVASVLYFGCNMDPSGSQDIQWPHTVIERCFSRHKKDYATLSATPDQFDPFVEAVSLMERTQPNYTAADLARIHVPVLVVHSEHDEFIKPEHAAYLAQTLPRARLVTLPGVSHFAPIQRPERFNRVLLAFLGEHAGLSA
ncbi:MAG TPA: alpha/beta hydrolase [Pararobbsia sp.]|nr:alpha/beta hydrolase [Pararobbsia sp.]